MYIKKIKRRHLKNINNVEIVIKRVSLTIPYILYAILYKYKEKKYYYMEEYMIHY